MDALFVVYKGKRGACLESCNAWKCTGAAFKSLEWTAWRSSLSIHIAFQSSFGVFLGVASILKHKILQEHGKVLVRSHGRN